MQTALNVLFSGRETLRMYTYIVRQWLDVPIPIGMRPRNARDGREMERPGEMELTNAENQRILRRRPLRSGRYSFHGRNTPWEGTSCLTLPPVLPPNVPPLACPGRPSPQKRGPRAEVRDRPAGVIFPVKRIQGMAMDTRMGW